MEVTRTFAPTGFRRQEEEEDAAGRGKHGLFGLVSTASAPCADMGAKSVELIARANASWRPAGLTAKGVRFWSFCTVLRVGLFRIAAAIAEAGFRRNVAEEHAAGLFKLALCDLTASASALRKDAKSKRTREPASICAHHVAHVASVHGCTLCTARARTRLCLRSRKGRPYIARLCGTSFTS